MNREILNYVEEFVDFNESFDEQDAITAIQISEMFNIKRNTASRYLNELLDEGRLIKVNTRPVLFFHKQLVESALKREVKKEYSSFAELKNARIEEKDTFDSVIGRNGSLSNVIDQLISATNYPEGLPILLNGESGTGKSMLAKKVYEYCLQQGILGDKSPFVVFNCAQYFNNPELLSSQLFGYKKGSFTGADMDRGGLIEEAEGGILFLDEVHRLPPEGQEKLFILMDQKVFSRVGETDNKRNANIRLIFATTEDVHSSFLPTFLRRIPMVCYLPNFSDRTYRERRDLVFLMLKKEANILRCSLRVSSTVIYILTHAEHKGNVGEVKNLIRRVCAQEFSAQKDKNPVDIRRSSIPEEMITANIDLLNEKKFLNEPVLFTPLMEIRESKEVTIFNRYADRFISNVLRTFNSLREDSIDQTEFQQQVLSDLYSFIDQLIFNDLNTSQEILNYMIRQIQESFQMVLHAKNSFFNGNDIFIIAHYLLKKNDNSHFNIDEAELERLYQYLQKSVKQDMATLFQMLENNLDISLTKFDKLFIQLTQAVGSVNQTEQSMFGGLIVAHGYATASSISSVVNRMLKVHIFDSFDMPLDVSVDELIERVEIYIKNNQYQEGLLLLVDMGSLHNIGRKLVQSISSPIILVNNVSTEMALWGGNLLQQGLSMIEISEKMKESGKIHCQIIYPEKKKKKMIVISCSTGYGTAIKLKEMFMKIMPEESPIQFAAQDFEQILKNGFEMEIFKSNEVIGLIGTKDPYIEGLLFISIEDLFSDKDNRLLKLLEKHTTKELAEVVNNEMIKNLSLNKIIDSLTILDSSKIITQIEPCIESLERFMNRQMNNNQKLTIYVHISCMIERLIRGQQMDSFPQDDYFIEHQERLCSIIRMAFQPIEQLYNISLPVEECYYIFNITQNLD
ncbi:MULTISPECIES: sigma 54-interacting transcriptional regulator [Enterococcaceae]|uniref:Fis family transcriptional regulator n=5 Tax=Enterococcaceae TaxID=81852 RepID=A0A430A2F8_9ENTE|nr:MULTISPECIES: sigma 54-interacting transcriptional regulator [Enterococcaceae]EJE4563078.1 sigma 54-interacting transcriptional regulator [Enterococcus faecium]EKY7883022.1 sigma 54-interacting transcriptional regulator [Enterococcus faecium]EKZ0059268.1 sigma 54-interacting transcriptional regulator [Enterococcus faecium]EKZ0497310.1 sigma 54-interacting transcriptional regulator [Enterococcus faecium]MBG7725293.1 sigma 54-interacting transcriptional regulator [Enterococcus faecium]